MKGIRAAAVLAGVVLLGAAQAHAVTIVLPRAGQVGVAVQGEYGGLASSGELGQEFGLGAGLAVHMVYRMRYDRAIGLSFETRRLDARGAGEFGQTAFPASPDSLVRTALTLQTFGGDIYQFFGTRSRTQGYLSASAGLAKINSWVANGDPVYPLAGDGLYLGVGGGAERFVYRSWAIDGSARYTAILLDGSANHELQLSLGMIFYAAY